MTAFSSGVDQHIAPELASSALVVIDTQVDFVDGGASPIAGTTQVLPAITGLLTAYRAAHLPIVHIVRLHDGDDVDLPRRTAIAAGASTVRPRSPALRSSPNCDHTARQPSMPKPCSLDGRNGSPLQSGRCGSRAGEPSTGPH